jgi:outer membrane receptor protein involved in Fe transport
MNIRLFQGAMLALAYSCCVPVSDAEDVLPLASDPLEVKVVAKRLDRARNGISVETGSSIYRFGSKDIAALPQGESTPLNQVMLQAPGVAQDSYGQLHVRGDHGDLQYRLNGIILPESISGFGQALDARFIDNVSLLTGALPAQYGYRTAGVVDIHTKSGALEPSGRVGVEYGSHHTQEYSGDMSGSKEGFSYYLTGSLLRNNLGIENPTSSYSALHDTTHQNKAFGYFSYVLDPSSRLSLMLGNSSARFQIPNSLDQTPAYTLKGVASYPSENIDERQNETTRYGVLALQGKVGENFDYQIAAFSRYTKVLFEPDIAGDLMYTGVAGRIQRSGLAHGFQADGRYTLNEAHTLRMGMTYTLERLSHLQDALTFPLDADGSQSSNQPISIVETNEKTTHQMGLYLQDEWKLTKKLTLNYGVRADGVQAYITDHQFSPRLGGVYQFSSDTILHAGYARYFTPPANELIPGTTISAFQTTTNASPGGTRNDSIQSEKTDYYDLGFSHKLSPYLTVGVDGYYKKIKNLLDEGQFGSALIFTPFNYDQGKIYGLELSGSYRKDKLSAYVNIARSVALGRRIISSQYLFDATESAYIANNWVHLDHDQALTVSAGASYLWQGTTYSADALFGSGLRRNFANTDHLPAYATVNLSAAHTFNQTPMGNVTGRLSMINLFDRVYEIRDGSGIGVGAPQFGQRRSVYLGLSKYF